MGSDTFNGHRRRVDILDADRPSRLGYLTLDSLEQGLCCPQELLTGKSLFARLRPPRLHGAEDEALDISLNTMGGLVPRARPYLILSKIINIDI
jgi:hypothetical protein